MTDHERESESTRDEMIAFPSQCRVRCPHCGADWKGPRDAREIGRYLCRSTDQTQSATCKQRTKEIVSINLVAGAREILNKLRHGAAARL